MGQIFFPQQEQGEGTSQKRLIIQKESIRKYDLAYLGECLVQGELAKRNFRVMRATFSFDFLGENGSRIEVKAALPSRTSKLRKGRFYEYKIWQFRLTTEKQQDCDFFVCVPFDVDGKTPLGYFIFPRHSINTLGKSNTISVYETDLSGNSKVRNKMNRNQYMNSWDLIFSFNKKC